MKYPRQFGILFQKCLTHSKIFLKKTDKKLALYFLIKMIKIHLFPNYFHRFSDVPDFPSHGLFRIIGPSQVARRRLLAARHAERDTQRVTAPRLSGQVACRGERSKESAHC